MRSLQMTDENKTEETNLQFPEPEEEIQTLKRSYATVGSLASLLTSKVAKFSQDSNQKNTHPFEILMHNGNVDLIVRELKSLPEKTREKALHESLKKIQTRILEMQNDPVCKSFEKNVTDLEAIGDKINSYLKNETHEVPNQESNSFR